ncbi:HPr family phosphocarrier protein [Peribacillus sp. SCS-26]|uniref:HPr family phosphocarrier protein n=1 Tax=Paraperibacillus marinus TaxID=3115295 RepID=UPI003905B4C2
MNEIISASISIPEKLAMKKIMLFYQSVKNYDGNVYLLCSQKLTDAKKLSKLVSFMLTINECDSLKIIVEGQDVSEKMQELLDIASPTQEQAPVPRYFLNPTDTIQL